MNREDHSAPVSSLPLFADAARARRKDPETSHEAARHASENLRKSQYAVLAAFRELGAMSDETLVDRYAELHGQSPTTYPDQSPSGLRTRRHELVLLGKIVFTGRRDENAAGKVKPRLWRLAAEAKGERVTVRDQSAPHRS
jgi:hypothetical protein